MRYLIRVQSAIYSWEICGCGCGPHTHPHTPTTHTTHTHTHTHTPLLLHHLTQTFTSTEITHIYTQDMDIHTTNCIIKIHTTAGEKILYHVHFSEIASL